MNASRRAATVVLAILLALFASPVWAAETGADEENILSMEVARLKVSKGTVWVRPADSLEWEEYSHNFPVAERSRVSVPQGAEAELQFRGSQFMLLIGGSEVDVLQLGDQKVSFRLRGGQVALSLAKDSFAPVRVKAPGNRDVRMDAPGLYWLTAEGEATKLLVRTGESSVTGEGMTPVVVKAGEEASIGKEVKVSRAGPAGSPPPAKVAEAPLTEAELKAGIPQAAATELRQYGEWVSTPDYGNVWRPYVADGWSPYYYGQWRWVYPYGWNWVGYEPWGWWPYHYGGWVSYPAFGWVWCPFNSFFSVGFSWGGYPYSYYNAYYSPANVRYANNGRYIRWVPERPGHAVPRAAPFSRNDARLAQWNRPLDSGTVMVRGQGGKPVPWDGQGVGGRTAASSRGMVAPRTGSAPGSSAARSGGGGAVSGAAGNRSRVASVDSGSVRPFSDGGGRVSAARPQRSGVPLLSASTGSGSMGAYGAGGKGRGYGVPYTNAGRGGEYRGYSGGYSAYGAAGQGRGYGVPYIDAGRGGYDGGTRGYGGYDGGPARTGTVATAAVAGVAPAEEAWAARAAAVGGGRSSGPVYYYHFPRTLEMILACPRCGFRFVVGDFHIPSGDPRPFDPSIDSGP